MRRKDRAKRGENIKRSRELKLYVKFRFPLKNLHFEEELEVA